MLTDFLTSEQIIVFGVFLIGLNLMLKLKTLNAPIDFDTANHLYFGFLRNRNIPFYSSYNPGIKYILPRLYSTFFGIIKNNINHFRFFNVIISSILIVIILYANPVQFIGEIPFYILFVLILNSLYTVYYISAIEFYEAPILIVVFLLPLVLPFIVAWPLQIVLITALFYGCKIVDVMYIIPATAYWFFLNNLMLYEDILITLGVIGIVLVFLIVYRKNVRKPIKKYLESSNNPFHQKNAFFLINPVYSLIIFYFCLKIFLLGNLYFSIILLTLLGIIVVQRRYTPTYFYPLLCVVFFIAFQSNLLASSEIFTYGWYVVALFFLVHTLPHILLPNSRDIDIRYRHWILFLFGWKEYLLQRDNDIKILNKKIPSSASVYLWGTNVPLLLLANLNHIGETYYSHNHLFYWSEEPNPKRYAKDFVRSRKPEYVIASLPMGGAQNAFPSQEFSDIYMQIDKTDGMQLYKLISH